MLTLGPCLLMKLGATLVHRRVVTRIILFPCLVGSGKWMLHSSSQLEHGSMWRKQLPARPDGVWAAWEIVTLLWALAYSVQLKKAELLDYYHGCNPRT